MEDNVQEFRRISNSLDHLHVFVTVFEEGSLSAAARKLNRAVSSISYAIAQLERQAGQPLLKRSKLGVELTAHGEAIFSKSRAIVDQSGRLSAQMRALGRGEEATLRILVDVLFPRDVLRQILDTFSKRNTSLRLQIFHASLNTMWDDLRNNSYDMALSISDAVPLDMDATPIGYLELSAYCASSHPLALSSHPLTIDDFRAARQIYFVSRPDIVVESVGRVFSEDIWTVDDIETLRQMVIGGLGWSFGAPDTYADALSAGTVKDLKPKSPNLQSRRTLCIVQMQNRALGVLGQSFADIVETCVSADAAISGKMT